MTTLHATPTPLVDTTICHFLNSAGKPYQYVAIRTDITARKTGEEKLGRYAQELAEKNKELETVVYVASHDLRSPLVKVQGFGKELAGTCERLKTKFAKLPDAFEEKGETLQLLSEEVTEALSFIQAGVAKMDKLLAGFLRFSRLGRAALVIGPLDMNAMMREITRAIAFQIEQSGAAVEISDLPPCLGDATHINQVFSNLLDNALKCLDPTREGQINVSGYLEKRAGHLHGSRQWNRHCFGASRQSLRDLPSPQPVGRPRRRLGSEPQPPGRFGNLRRSGQSRRGDVPVDEMQAGLAGDGHDHAWPQRRRVHQGRTRDDARTADPRAVDARRNALR